MKTAISSPYRVSRAPRGCRKLRKSRSSSRRAVAEYLTARSGPVRSDESGVRQSLLRRRGSLGGGAANSDGRNGIPKGEVWWADLPDPSGSGPGFRRPVVVLQGDALNRSRLATVVCVPLTSNLRWADAPGNVVLRARNTGLPKDSVANLSQVVAIDKTLLAERTGRISRAHIDLLFTGLDVVLGR